jgi:toxin ParE1/3/4
MIKVRFLPAAENEFLAQMKYYAQQGSGLDAKFEQEVRRVVDSIRKNPTSGSPGPSLTRRKMLRGFPFSLVYYSRPSEIIVIALMHHRRKPNYWFSRT